MRQLRHFPRNEKNDSRLGTRDSKGCVKNTNPEYSRFLYISLGSASEVEYLLMLCNDLHMIDENNYKTLSEEIQEIKKMLTALIKKVKTVK